MRRRKKKEMTEEEQALRMFWSDVLRSHDGDEVVTPTGVTLTVRRTKVGQTCRDCALYELHRQGGLASTLAYDKGLCERIEAEYGVTCGDVPCGSMVRGVGRGSVILVRTDC